MLNHFLSGGHGSCRFRIHAKSAVLLITLAALPAHAVQVTDQNLSFSTESQSIWSSGEAFVFNYLEFFGFDVNPGSYTVNPSAKSGTGYSVDPYFLFDTDFRTGMEVGASVNGGSVDANLDYDVSISVPSTITPGQAFSLSGSASKLNTSSFQSSPANAEAWIDGILDVYFGGYARFVTSGIALGSHDYRMGDVGFTDHNSSNTPYRTLANVNYSPEIVGINRNGSGQLHVLGTNQGGSGSEYSVGSTTITAGNWNVSASGSLNGNSLSGSDEKTMLTATLDIDQLATGGAPVLGTGVAHDWGVISMDIGYEIIDIKTWLSMGLRQNFTIDSTVQVNLQFSEDVLVNGVGMTDSLTASIDAIPDITLFSDSVTVTPEYLINATLNNDTDITFDGGLDIVLLEGHIYAAYDAGIWGSGTAANASLGPVYESHDTIPLFDIDVFSDTFDLGGFTAIQGDSFVLTAGLQGDLNGDGFVGLDDLDIILGNWNANVSSGDLSAGNLNGDGYVGLDDLDIVLGNWNAGTPPISVANIPEPAASVCLAVSGILLFRLRKNVTG